MIKGKSKFVAFSEGFRNALKAIIDSNITTLITAAALYRFGTGPIRGFAVTLAIGICHKHAYSYCSGKGNIVSNCQFPCNYSGFYWRKNPQKIN